MQNSHIFIFEKLKITICWQWFSIIVTACFICKMELFEREWNAYLFGFLTTEIRRPCELQINRSCNRKRIPNMEIIMEYQRYQDRVPVAYSVSNTLSFFEILSKHPNLTMETIQKHPRENWDWAEISGNPAITMDDVEKYPKFLWIFNRLSENPNMTAKMLQKYPKTYWNFEKLALNPFLGDKRQFLNYKVKNTFLISVHEHINDVANYETTQVCKCSVIELVFADIYIVKIIAKN